MPSALNAVASRKMLLVKLHSILLFEYSYTGWNLEPKTAKFYQTLTAADGRSAFFWRWYTFVFPSYLGHHWGVTVTNKFNQCWIWSSVHCKQDSVTCSFHNGQYFLVRMYHSSYLFHVNLVKMSAHHCL